ncbi:MAG: permease, partial [Planctomycetota bacterium]
MEYVSHILIAFWATLAEMAPWLIFGFVAAGVLSVFFSTRFIERHLGGRGLGPVFKASVLGVPLPICSCGVIPVSASLYRHGASKGATSSFLLSTPQTGVDSILATYALMGPVFAVTRPVIALVNGVLGGLL